MKRSADVRTTGALSVVQGAAATTASPRTDPVGEGFGDSESPINEVLAIAEQRYRPTRQLLPFVAP